MLIKLIFIIYKEESTCVETPVMCLLEGNVSERYLL